MLGKSAIAVGVVGLGLAGALSTEAQTPPPIPVPPVPLSPSDVTRFAFAAQTGATNAEWRLGHAYETGDGVRRNLDTAVTWLRKAARQGSRIAMFELATLYQQAPELKPEPGEPDWQQIAADQGWGASQEQIGRMYAAGINNRPKDVVAAYKWFTLAANAADGRIWGDPAVALRDDLVKQMTPAQIAEGKQQADNWLALPLTPDQAIDRGMDAYNAHSDETAVAILSPLAMAGQVRAQFSLGIIYMNGKAGVQSDMAAAGWLQKAADQGHAGAEHFLGVIYAGGQGVPRNPVTSAAWEMKAAQQGLASAEDDLGLMYSKHFGLPADDAATVSWLEKAAAQGEGRAQYLLGGLYTFGDGVPKDMVQAYKWKYLATIYPAADPSYPQKAKADLDWMATSMSKAQLDQAITEAKAWQPVFEVTP